MRRRALLGALAASPAWAQAPLRMAPSEELRQLALEVMDAVGAPVLYERVFPELRTSFIGFFRQHGMTEANATRAFEGLILPEFRERTPEMIAAISAPLYRRYTEAELREALRVLRLPAMRRQREATLGGPGLTLGERFAVIRLRWREPMLKRLSDDRDALSKEMAEIGREVAGRIAEQAVRKNINTLIYNGLRT